MTAIIRKTVFCLLPCLLIACVATKDEARDLNSCQQAATASCVSGGCSQGDEAWETMVTDCMDRKGYFYSH